MQQYQSSYQQAYQQSQAFSQAQAQQVAQPPPPQQPPPQPQQAYYAWNYGNNQWPTPAESKATQANKPKSAGMPMPAYVPVSSSAQPPAPPAPTASVASQASQPGQRGVTLTFAQKQKPAAWGAFQSAKAASAAAAAATPSPPPPPRTPPPPPPPSASKSASAQGGQGGSQNWPPALKKYVERAFAGAGTDEELRNVEAYLRDFIKGLMADGRLWSRDWNTEPPLPGWVYRTGGRRSPGRSPSAHSPDPSGVKFTRTVKGAAGKKGSKRKKPFGLGEDDAQKQRRMRRFDAVEPTGPRYTASLFTADAPSTGGQLAEWDSMTVRGTCTVLEKRYLRLTSAPDPSTVRPEPVLQAAVQLVKKKWKQNRDYLYVCEQMKSIRQDLTVQRIKNGFTVRVYEMHARLALENGDIGEYNQCQTQLRELYREGLSGCEDEFLGYRVLYFLYAQRQEDLARMLMELSPAQKASPNVRHALDVRGALALNNYHRFFVLLHRAPDMGRYLMAMFADTQRMLALKAMTRAYRPVLPLDFLAAELGFDTMGECAEFLQRNKVPVDSASLAVDCKAAGPSVAAWQPPRPGHGRH